MANLPDICVARKIESSDINHMPAVQFSVRLDLNQIFLFMDGHYLTSSVLLSIKLNGSVRQLFLDRFSQYKDAWGC